MIYALCTWGENGVIILRLADNETDCVNLKKEIEETYKKNGYHFSSNNYWVESINITKKGVLWESD